mgnify:CR=1 FL=1
MERQRKEKRVQPRIVNPLADTAAGGEDQSILVDGDVRELALPMGFVDIKVCAVTEVWSGLKLVLRKELR